jgi:hypothetical protein
VTVVGSVRRLDLAVPAAAPVAELLPDVVALAGEVRDTAALPRWVLGRLDAGDLSPDVSLADAGVPDGAVLYLRRVDEPVVGLQGADVVERAATPGADRADVVDRLLLASTAAALLILLALLLLRDGRSGAAAAATALGLAAVAAGRWMSGRAEPGTGATAAVVAATALPLLAVAAYLQTAASPEASPTVTAAAALGGALLGAVLAASAVPVLRPAAAAAAGLLAGAAGGVLLSLLVTRPQAAALTAVAAVLLVPLIPRLVLRASGLRLSGPRQTGRTTDAQFATARAALPWALAADGLLVLAAAGVLVRGGSLTALCLVAVCGLLLVLRSRGRTGGGPPLFATGQAVVVVAAAGLALRNPGQPEPLLVLGAMAVVDALASVLPRSSVDRPRWAQRRRRLEVIAVVALVLLLAAVLGVFAAVVDLARGVE